MVIEVNLFFLNRYVMINLGDIGIPENGAEHRSTNIS